MRRLLKPVFALVGLMATLACAAEAQAGLLPVNISITPEGGNFRYTYNVVLTSDSLLQTGDYFTIYDFQGYVDDTNFQPPDFDFSSELVGPTPAGLLPVDDPDVINLTWTYTGPTTQVGQVGLGNFWAISEFGSTTLGYFTAQAHSQSNGQTNNNITTTNVPVPSGPGDPPVVPEPTTLVLMGLGLPAIGFARALRRRKSN